MRAGARELAPALPPSVALAAEAWPIRARLIRQKTGTVQLLLAVPLQMQRAVIKIQWMDLACWCVGGGSPSLDVEDVFVLGAHRYDR
jgi:hypothetical protein